MQSIVESSAPACEWSQLYILFGRFLCSAAAEKEIKLIKKIHSTLKLSRKDDALKSNRIYCYDGQISPCLPSHCVVRHPAARGPAVQSEQFEWPNVQTCLKANLRHVCHKEWASDSLTCRLRSRHVSGCQNNTNSHKYNLTPLKLLSHRHLCDSSSHLRP